MNLKNYTSEVPAITSMGKIEKILVEAGATDISKKYEEGVCIAIRFRMPVDNMILFFELPARVDACFKVLWGQIVNKNRADENKHRQQAERTAWKIIAEWIECQISMIRLEQAELLQVFLPYVYDPANDQTFFQKLKEGGFKQLPNG